MKTRLLFCLLLISTALYGQQTITVKYFGLTIHPAGDKTANIQPYKLDKNAVFVANFGGFIGYERYLHEDLVSAKTISAVFTDCSGGFAVVQHLGIRGTLMKLEKHRIYAGLGPTLLVRDSWTRFGDAYQSSGFFNLSNTKTFGDVQWKLIPYGFEFEYDYVFTDKNQLTVSFTPGVPLAAILSVGWKHWFNVKSYKQYKVYVPKD